MASISIRKLDQKIYDQLRNRALRHGFSMEEEVRQIISQAVAAPDSIGAVFKKHFGKKNGIHLVIEPRLPHKPMEFGEE